MRQFRRFSPKIAYNLQSRSVRQQLIKDEEDSVPIDVTSFNEEDHTSEDSAESDFEPSGSSSGERVPEEDDNDDDDLERASSAHAFLASAHRLILARIRQ